MYIVPTLGGQPDPAAAGSLLERGGQRRGRLHKNVCGIPQSAPFFSLTRHPCFRSLPLSFASAAFVVSFIIPLICCAPARDHHNLSRMYFLPGLPHSSCVYVPVFVYKLCVSFSAVECPIQVPASYSLLPSRFLSVLLPLSAHTALLARGFNFRCCKRTLSIN